VREGRGGAGRVAALHSRAVRFITIAFCRRIATMCLDYASRLGCRRERETPRSTSGFQGGLGIGTLIGIPILPYYERRTAGCSRNHGRCQRDSECKRHLSPKPIATWLTVLEASDSRSNGKNTSPFLGCRLGSGGPSSAAIGGQRRSAYARPGSGGGTERTALLARKRARQARALSVGRQRQYDRTSRCLRSKGAITAADLALDDS